MNIKEDLLVKYLQNKCTESEISLLNTWLAEKEENKQELFLLEASLKSPRLKCYAKPEFIAAERARLQERIDRDKK
jgi:hypothetical protein